jgi:hypothetical protein
MTPGTHSSLFLLLAHHQALLAADDTLADKYKPGKGSKKGKAVGKTSMKQRSASSSSPQVSLDAVRCGCDTWCGLVSYTKTFTQLV